MADIYFRSAAKALNDFDNLRSELENYLNKCINEGLTSLSNEMETLLYRYEEVVDELEKANERIQELKEELSNVEDTSNV